MHKTNRVLRILLLLGFTASLVFCLLPFFSFHYVSDTSTLTLSFSPFNLLTGKGYSDGSGRAGQNILLGICFFVAPLLGLLWSLLRKSFFRGFLSIFTAIAGGVFNVLIALNAPEFLYYGKNLEAITRTLGSGANYTIEIWTWISALTFGFLTVIAIAHVVSDFRAAHAEVREDEYNFVFERPQEEEKPVSREEKAKDDVNIYSHTIPDLREQEYLYRRPAAEAEFAQAISDFDLMEELDRVLSSEEEDYSLPRTEARYERRFENGTDYSMEEETYSPSPGICEVCGAACNSTQSFCASCGRRLH